MKWAIWKMPPIFHELILKITGYRLVLIYENPPDWLLQTPVKILPAYYLLWEHTIRKQCLIWTKRWPL